MTAKARAGFVYCLGDNELRCKIGWTTNLPQRIKQILSCSPIPLTLFFAVRVSNPYQIEQALHAELSDQQLHGEWFQLGGDQLAFEIIGKLMDSFGLESFCNEDGTKFNFQTDADIERTWI